MSYQALYRTWRPQRFDEIVGQPVITQTLKNALITNQISHAYLFTGPRGTGKTSAAKILAKAVNCPNLKDGEPCNECATCLAINKGAFNDVIEIDAASNNGVEEIRNIRDKAKYAPTEGKYKVYIIDEVHMLSTGAFNALLKTLEEPPEHVIFILATTEPQKIPATIISRTQRFDFKRIKASDILKRMEYILSEKNIDYDDKALKVIAKSAEGGMRDALSILDQALSYSNDKVTYESTLSVTGSVTRDKLQSYIEAVFNSDVQTGLKMVQEILDDGKDANQFIEDLVDYCQNILLYHQDPEMVQKSELGLLGSNFKKIAGEIGSELIYQYVEIMSDVQNQMRYSSHPDVYLDILTVKLANAKKSGTVAGSKDEDHGESGGTKELEQQLLDLKNQVSELQSELDDSKKKSPVNETKDQNVTKSKPVHHQDTNKQVQVNLTKVYEVLGKATRKDLTAYQDIWQELLQSLSVTQRAVMHVSNPVAASDQGVVVAFDYGFLYQKAGTDGDLMDALQNGLDRILGFVPTVVFVPNDEWPQIRSDYLKKHQSGADKSEANNSETKSDAPDASSDEQPEDTKGKKNNDSLNQAKQMFGNDIINVKDD